MKRKREYKKPLGRVLFIITEDSLCVGSVNSGGVGDNSDVLVENWEDGGNVYSGVDL
ncbi:hypothetical protein [Sphingobacterium bovisgrunnientis]|jgi:hypothetical protein|uniref:hypothetical protein n=1 Tax=Sphingobacterium bovisgrunnientis TaxID=1874697 RepID=UPI00135C84E8|nr:hypothetical protein [Sphingobacterium bovisgrunnientis]